MFPTRRPRQWLPRLPHISSCRKERAYSTRSGRTPSGVGIRISALERKPRKRLDPRESPALRDLARRPTGGVGLFWTDWSSRFGDAYWVLSQLPLCSPYLVVASGWVGASCGLIRSASR